MEYYVYAYLREDGTPYYIGKGKGGRAYKSQRATPRPKERERIKILAHKLSEPEAFLLEIKLIKYYGRIDLGTGILRNKTNGGDGAVQSPEINQKRREFMTGLRVGDKHPMYGLRGPLSPFFGKPNPKLSESRLKTPKQQCPHCNRSVDPGNYKKYHGENCATVKPRIPLPKQNCVHCNKWIGGGNYIRYHGNNCKLASSDFDQSHITQ